jgi:hypothetical protein
MPSEFAQPSRFKANNLITKADIARSCAEDELSIDARLTAG